MSVNLIFQNGQQSNAGCIIRVEELHELIQSEMKNDKLDKTKF